MAMLTFTRPGTLQLNPDFPWFERGPPRPSQEVPESLPGGLFSTKPTDKRPGVRVKLIGLQSHLLNFWFLQTLWISLDQIDPFYGWWFWEKPSPMGLIPNGQWFGDGSSWFFRRIRSLWSRIRRTMVFMDLRLFTFWEVEIPPQKNHAISIGKLMINCWMMLDVAFFSP